MSKGRRMTYPTPQTVAMAPTSITSPKTIAMDLNGCCSASRRSWFGIGGTDGSR